MKLLTKESSPIVKILMSIAILMTSISFASVLMSFFKYLLPDFALTHSGELCVQAIGSLVMFGLPSWLCIWLFTKDFKTNFSTLKNKRWLIWAIIIPIVCIPINDILTNWNNNLHFEGEEIFRQIQTLSEKESEYLLTSDSFGGFLAISFVLAIIPAIVEELFFRGVIQNYLKDLCKNTFIAILLTSAFFSLMHFELFSFLPRFMLSILLGYVFVASKNLIIPMICHFINNFTVCIIYFLYSKEEIASQDTSTFSQHPLLIITSLFIILFIILFENFFVLLRKKE
jgi:membrane protease YdiL (CAAX protease family)